MIGKMMHATKLNALLSRVEKQEEQMRQVCGGACIRAPGPNEPCLPREVSESLVELASVIRQSLLTPKTDPDSEEVIELKCSFCGKSQKHVKKLIAGPGVYICNECIETSRTNPDDEEVWKWEAVWYGTDPPIVLTHGNLIEIDHGIGQVLFRRSEDQSSGDPT